MKNKDGGTSRFNVSDALDVPLRGFLLRLRRVDGSGSVKDIEPGSQLRLTSPDGLERTVTVVAKSLTGGRNTQERLEKTGQLDVIVPSEEAYADGTAIGIGWTAEPGHCGAPQARRPAATEPGQQRGWLAFQHPRRPLTGKG